METANTVDIVPFAHLPLYLRAFGWGVGGGDEEDEGGEGARASDRHMTVAMIARTTYTMG